MKIRARFDVNQWESDMSVLQFGRMFVATRQVFKLWLFSSEMGFRHVSQRRY